MWLNLTFDIAEQVKEFYQQVIGWRSESVSMGDYDDFTMLPVKSDIPVAGICHVQ